jgi:hypothetical protein
MLGNRVELHLIFFLCQAFLAMVALPRLSHKGAKSFMPDDPSG